MENTILTNISLVALGGAIGASARYLFGILFYNLLPSSNGHYSTLFVNIAGSLLMGILIAMLARYPSELNSNLRLFFAVGILGSFTTFSTFSLDFVTMYENGQIMEAMTYALISVTASILALFLGLQIVRAIF